MSEVIDLIQATVMVEQASEPGRRTVGSGFLVTSTGADGRPRTILVTAHHVFAEMPKDRASVGLRELQADGRWRFAPVSVRIRETDGGPAWTRHPTQDIAAIELPQGVTSAGVPAAELPGAKALETLGVGPGDEVLILGYPHGVAANAAGFPILRSGWVASYPLSPADRYPTYMVDFNVFAGNSGGPVYVRSKRGTGMTIVGVLTQQANFEGERLAIGNVTQADFISETISLLDGEPADVIGAANVARVQDAAPASASPQRTALERLRESWQTLKVETAIFARRLWIVCRDQVLDLVTRDPKPVGR